MLPVSAAMSNEISLFRQSRSKLNMSASIFCHRTGYRKVWNELPIDTDFSSIDLFKRALDGFNFTTYCDI